MRRISFSIFLVLVFLSVTSNLHASTREIVDMDNETVSVTPTVKSIPLTPTDDRIKRARELRGEMIKRYLERLNTRREIVKERIENKREELRDKTEEFKDQRKAKLVEKINDNLNKINDRKITLMLHNLTRMEELLGKVKDKVEEKGAGKDLKDVNDAIADAQTAIDSAKAAVEVQSGKDYSITVTTESSIRTDAQKAKDLLLSDLRSLHEKIVEARKAVANAISTAYSTLGKENVDAL